MNHVRRRLSLKAKSQPSSRHRKPSQISVILSTYNAPLWLEKSLWGFANQTHTDFEVVIADDGSDSKTANVIDRIRRQSGLTIKHAWHPDDGFRKCTILNHAIGKSAGDYLLFSDGDCIPRADFVQQHYLAAQPGRFLSGGYFKLPMPISEQIDRDDIESGRAFTLGWLRAGGLKFSHRAIRLMSYGRFAHLLNHLTTTRPTWNGHNASGWAEDVRRANGFDQRMRYGGEDRELGERLENAGIRGKHVRFQTLCLHLDHSRGYVREADLKRNREIRDVTLRMGRTKTDHGIKHAA
jgi:glycosyltransferase involved in cell wall biosynthesis